MSSSRVAYDPAGGDYADISPASLGRRQEGPSSSSLRFPGEGRGPIIRAFKALSLR